MKTIISLIIFKLFSTLAIIAAIQFFQLSPVLGSEKVVNDWLFQVDNVPTFEKVKQEIARTRELAARIAKLETAPDLSAELKALAEIEKILLKEDSSSGLEIKVVKAIYSKVKGKTTNSIDVTKKLSEKIKNGTADLGDFDRTLGNPDKGIKDIHKRRARRGAVKKLEVSFTINGNKQERQFLHSGTVDLNPFLKDEYLAVRKIKRKIMFANPLVDFNKIVLIDNPFPAGREPGHEARHRNGFMAQFGGRLVVLDGLNPDAKVTKLLPTPEVGGEEASFWRPDLSWDGKKVLVSMKPEGGTSFHIYAINVDGSGAKQLTFGDYDDLDPIYAPDGKILFSTTRGNTYIRCMPYTHSFCLARCDADGKNIYVISRNSECDYTPSIMNDGRVLFTRWEYTDKALWRVQSLWVCNPDGTNVRQYWGNQSAHPDMLIEARQIPNSNKVTFIGAGHHRWFDGPVGIVDNTKGRDYPDGVYNVTPEIGWSEVGRGPKDQNFVPSENYKPGPYKAYKTPYPLSEELMLVSACKRAYHNPPSTGGEKFELFLMDVYGNRELIWSGDHNAYYAMPLKPRKMPRALPDLVEWPVITEDKSIPQKIKPGTLFSHDVLEGVKGINREDVKSLRVIQMDHKVYTTWDKTVQHDGPAVSISSPESVKYILGTTPVEKDGSVAFIAPAGKAIYFQLLNKKGEAIHTMRSFTGVMPGEVRGCVGCHEERATAPPPKGVSISMALKRGPQPLTPPAWGEESIGYLRFAQPVFDKYCINCHNTEKVSAKKVPFDFTLRDGGRWRHHPSSRPNDATPFKEPYLMIVGGRLGWGGRPRSDYVEMINGYPVSVSGVYLHEGQGRGKTGLETMPPYSAFSPKSKIVRCASSGEHHKVKVDKANLDRLVAWVDTNGPYLGVEEIKKMYDPKPKDRSWKISPRIATAPYHLNRFNIRQDGDSKAILGEGKYFQGDFPPKPPKPKGPPIKVKVIKATYGAEDINVDVTEKMIPLAAKNQAGLVYLGRYNEHFGDPNSGVVKKLTVTFEADGKQKTKEFSENSPVNFR